MGAAPQFTHRGGSIVTHYITQSLALGLALAMCAAASAYDGFSSQPRLAGMRSNKTSEQGQPTQRRSLLEGIALSPERPATNWRSDWSRPSQPSEPKSFLTRTRDLLMPWAATPERPSPTGTRRVYAGKTPPELQSQPNRGIFGVVFSGLFGGEEEPRRPSTANEFLGQERP
jgi:hypothetical protein